ncbi:MAG: DNA methyltransferase, partial [Nitrospinota bacterium]
TEYTARAFRGKRVYDKWKPHPIGKHPDDVWIMQPIMPSSKERLSYPTQKPLRLLDRIIKGSSNPEDLVFDPFCGCGTTLVAAHRLKRKWLGIDVSPTACKLMKRRLSREAATKVEIVGLPLEISELRSLNYVEFQNWVIGSLGGTVSDKPSRDMGIDGYSYMVREPIQVKQQENVGRPELDKFQSAIRRKKKRKGVLVGFSFTKGTYEEAARLKHDDGIEIELMNVDDVRRALEST